MRRSALTSTTVKTTNTMALIPWVLITVDDVAPLAGFVRNKYAVERPNITNTPAARKVVTDCTRYCVDTTHQIPVSKGRGVSSLSSVALT